MSSRNGCFRREAGEIGGVGLATVNNRWEGAQRAPLRVVPKASVDQLKRQSFTTGPVADLGPVVGVSYFHFLTYVHGYCIGM